MQYIYTGKSTTTSVAASISDSSVSQTRVYQQRTRMQLADRCQRVFRRHGGVTLDLSLFLPRSKQTLDQVPDSSVSVMDEDGNLGVFPMFTGWGYTAHNFVHILVCLVTNNSSNFPY